MHPLVMEALVAARQQELRRAASQMRTGRWPCGRDAALGAARKGSRPAVAGAHVPCSPLAVGEAR